MTEIQQRLFELRDERYQEFNSRLLPKVSPDAVIGVRTPVLRKLAAQMRKEGRAEDFLRALPHRYVEENCLHGFLLESIRDFRECTAELDLFLPYVDNWMTCDLVNPKILGKYPQELFLKIQEWMASEEVYTIRYGINMLMRYFLKENFRAEYLEMPLQIRTREYYVQMAAAWFYATALTYQYESAVLFLQEKRLEPWIHNKTIQKAAESRQIPADRKAYLRTLKIRNQKGNR